MVHGTNMNVYTCYLYTLYDKQSPSFFLFHFQPNILILPVSLPTQHRREPEHPWSRDSPRPVPHHHLLSPTKRPTWPHPYCQCSDSNTGCREQHNGCPPNPSKNNNWATPTTPPTPPTCRSTLDDRQCPTTVCPPSLVPKVHGHVDAACSTKRKLGCCRIGR